MFGFTGTPIFADNAASNAYGKRTTKDLFQERLHKYVITTRSHDSNLPLPAVLIQFATHLEHL
jgi:type I restriction enzyme, R subunit